MSAKSVGKPLEMVIEPPAFKSWRESISSNLQGWQDRLLRGPMWSGCSAADVGKPLKARPNIAMVSRAAISERLRKDQHITSEPVIQEGALEAFAKAHPGARVWVKADAKDLKPALMESGTGEWNGDAQLHNDDLLKLRQEYDLRKRRLDEGQAVTDEQSMRTWTEDLLARLTEDNSFLVAGHGKAVTLYRSKIDKNLGNDKLMELNWAIAEHVQLLHKCQGFISRARASLEKDWEAVRDGLKILFDDYADYLCNLFKRKRTAATHVLVIMVSEEQRKTKPYAMPLQYIPCQTLRDQAVRDLLKQVKTRLTQKGLIVAGTTTDGEYCSLRSLGENHVTHLADLVRLSRLAVSKKRKPSLEAMLFPNTVDEEGVPLMVDTPVPVHVCLLLHMLRGSRTDEQCIDMLRPTLVPEGYQVHPFRPNTEETYLDKLRSIVATFTFRDMVQCIREETGRDFATYAYIPDTDVATAEPHHDRADHCHLLKRIAGHLRELRYEELQEEGFRMAMIAPDTGLTHAALVGLRKQSVPDAERLLSCHVARWLRIHGYNKEAEFVQIVADWHEASDGRGINQLQRCRANYKMLNYLLDDLIPWCHKDGDLSTIDINRSMNNIRGMSRETFVEVIANIESQEYRRRLNKSIGYHEHPRAATSDDVEQFFSMCVRQMGPSFTLKEFKYRWHRLVVEFSRRMDEDLPFYYWTLNERFKTIQDDFDEVPEVRQRARSELEDGQDIESHADDQESGLVSPTSHGDDDDDDDDVDLGQAMEYVKRLRNHPLRLHRLRINRREDAAIFAANREYLPARHHRSIRTQFHTVASLPPAP